MSESEARDGEGDEMLHTWKMSLREVKMLLLVLSWYWTWVHDGFLEGPVKDDGPRDANDSGEWKQTDAGDSWTAIDQGVNTGVYIG